MNTTQTNQAPTHKIWRNEPTELDHIFKPKSVAVVGASETPNSVGRTVIEHLFSGSFQGKVYPVHKTRETVFGRAAFKDVLAIPDEVDLAVITTPASIVPQIIEDCVAKKFRRQ